MRVWLSLIVVLASMMLVSPVKAEELRLSVTLQEFSGTNVGRCIAEAAGNQAGLVTVISKLKAGKVFFSQSLNVTDSRTLDETIVVDNKTVKF